MRYSWRQARDPALPSGDINATVLNYAALKFFRTSICSEAPPRPTRHVSRSHAGWPFRAGKNERRGNLGAPEVSLWVGPSRYGSPGRHVPWRRNSHFGYPSHAHLPRGG